MSAPLDELLKAARTVCFRYYKISESKQKELFAAMNSIVTPELKQALHDYYYQNPGNFIEIDNAAV